MGGGSRDPIWTDFFTMININDLERGQFDLAAEKLDEINFDPFSLLQPYSATSPLYFCYDQLEA